MSGSKNTAWIAGTGVLALLAVVATYFLLVAPKRAEAADLHTQRAQVAVSNETLAQQTELLKAQFATLDAQKARLAEIRQTLPAQADVPALLRQLGGYAAASGVTLTAVTPSAASVYTSSSGAAKDSTGIVQIPLNVKIAGTFVQTELFVKNVQADMTRFFGVENVTVTEGGIGSVPGQVSTSIQGRIFVFEPTATTGTTATPASAEGAAAPDTATTTGSAN